MGMRRLLISALTSAACACTFAVCVPTFGQQFHSVLQGPAIVPDAPQVARPATSMFAPQVADQAGFTQGGEPQRANLEHRWARLQQEYQQTLGGRRVPAKYSSHQDERINSLLNAATGQDDPLAQPANTARIPTPSHGSRVNAFADPPFNRAQDPQGVPPRLPGEIPGTADQTLPIPRPNQQSREPIAPIPQNNDPLAPTPQNYPPGSVTPPGSGNRVPTPVPNRPSYGVPPQGSGTQSVPPQQVAPGFAPAPNGYPNQNYQPAPGFTQPYAQPYAQPQGYPQTFAQPTFPQPSVYQPVAPVPVYQANAQAGGNNGCGPCEQYSQMQRCFEPQFYLSLFAGSNNPNLSPIGGDDPGLYDLGGGGIFGGALGRSQGNNLRTELEFSLRTSDAETFTLNGLSDDIEGSLDVYSGMLNAYWDFKEIGPRCLTPYIGGGIGFAFYDTDFLLDGAPITSDTGDDSSFAYQFIAGVNYNMYQSVNLFLEYRRFFSDDLTITGTPGFTGDTDRYDLESGSVLGGIRIKF